MTCVGDDDDEGDDDMGDAQWCFFLKHSYIDKVCRMTLVRHIVACIMLICMPGSFRKQRLTCNKNFKMHKEEMQRRSKLILSERPFKILQN